MERRGFARKKRRLEVQFKVEDSHCTGFTYDISPSGIFIRSVRLPMPGTYMTASVRLAEGRHVVVRGRVVRSFRVPATLTSLVPSGFSIRLSDTPEEYYQYFAAL